MASKAFLMFALLLAAAFLVDAANEQSQAKEVEESKQAFGGRGGGFPGRGCGFPGRRGGFPGRGGRGGFCRFGCCGRGFSGGCRCCVRSDEIPEPMYRPEVVEVHN